jgi:hypothetical protein
MPLVEAYINLQQSAALGSSSEAYAFTLAQAEMRDLRQSIQTLLKDDPTIGRAQLMTRPNTILNTAQ